MMTKRALRYLAPNIITSVNILLGMMSVAASYHGDFVLAGWLIAYAALFDRVDGFVARLVRGASEFGVQMDSFADFLNFGLAPSALAYCSLGSSTALPFHEGFDRYLLLAGCVLWSFAAAIRLARYNITEDVPSPLRMRIFFGVPTTLVGGLFATWFLALYKYAPPGKEFPGLSEPFGGTRLFDHNTPLWVWSYTPVIMLIGAYLMVSSLRMPKSWYMRSNVTKFLVYGSMVTCVTLGLSQHFPELIIWPPTLWMVGFLIWGALSPVARQAQPPPVFPSVDPPPGKEPKRPEDDLLPEGLEPGLGTEADYAPTAE